MKTISMIKTLAATVVALGMTQASFAASVTETFEGLTGGGTVAIAGTSSIAGFTMTNLDDALRCSLGTAGVYTSGPFAAGNTQYLIQNGLTQDWLQFNGGTIPTNSGTIQLAMLVRVDSLPATGGTANRLDLFTLDTASGSYSPYFNVRIGETAGGIFRTTTENNWPGATSPISSTLFKTAAPGNLGGAGWRIFVFKITPSVTPAAGGYTVWTIDPADGVSTLVQTYTGATNATAQATVNRFALGLSIGGSSVGAADMIVSVDQMTFIDDAFASDAALLAAVRTGFGTPSSVSEWSLMN